MIKIGLTGGIGSGKTYVASIFSEMNIPVYNSDDRAKYLMAFNIKVKNELINAFGPECFNSEGLNRKFLASEVFNDKNKLKTINQIVHPAVQSDFITWCAQQRSPYIIKEAAILIESGANKQVDKLIVVTAPLWVRINRIEARDKLSKTEIEARIANQMTDDERLKYADFEIINDGIMLVVEQIKEIHNKILNL